MTRRPSRAQMCDWLSGALMNVGPVMPFNPAAIEQMTYNARDADMRLDRLSRIAGDLGWHADADLDAAWEAIQKYNALPPRHVVDDYAKPSRWLASGSTAQDHTNRSEGGI